MKVSDDLPALSAETKGSGDRGPTKTRWGSGFSGQIWEIGLVVRRPVDRSRYKQLQHKRPEHVAL